MSIVFWIFFAILATLLVVGFVLMLATASFLAGKCSTLEKQVEHLHRLVEQGEMPDDDTPAASKNGDGDSEQSYYVVHLN